MLEALWTVEFESNLGLRGGGVLVFETDKIFGGDLQYYYLGNYKVQNGVLEAEVDVKSYTGTAYSVFGGFGDFSIKARGPVQEPVMVLNGYLTRAPHLKIIIRCTHRTDLP